MTGNDRARILQQRIEAAMTPLINDPRFMEFISVLRQCKDEAIYFAASHDSVKDQRACLAALGHVRALADIIDTAESHRQMVEDRVAQFEEQKAEQQHG